MGVCVCVCVCVCVTQADLRETLREPHGGGVSDGGIQQRGVWPPGKRWAGQRRRSAPGRHHHLLWYQPGHLPHIRVSTARAEATGALTSLYDTVFWIVFNGKGVTFSDEPTENYHPTYAPFTALSVCVFWFYSQRVPPLQPQDAEQKFSDESTSCYLLSTRLPIDLDKTGQKRSTDG